MKEVLIFPFNGNGIEALSCLGKSFRLLGFVDDVIEKQGYTSFGVQVYDRNIIDKKLDSYILAVPGSPVSYGYRKEIIESLNIPDHRYATVIHPTASVSLLARIGKNVLIMAGVVITSNAIIGNHVCILPNTVIHHDVRIDDFALIGSNVTIAGNSVVEENCYIGSGSSIINNVTIGKHTLIGLGTNVVKSLPERSKVIGNPARQV